MTDKTDLSKWMRERADADELPDDHDLRTLATGFDEAALGFFGEPQTHTVKQFMGAWSRARRAWCDYVGLPLL